MITGKNISKKYEKVYVLQGVNIDIEPGQITVLIGPSGSGKTTLLKSLSLIENPSSGSISFDGDTFIFPKVKEKVRRQFSFSGTQTVGVVFQNLDLIPHWTNRQNILKPLGEKISTEDLSELNTLYEMFNMEAFIDKLPHQCSKGEQQRVAFIRAVMLKPKYLFLDEITSALDPELIATLFKYLISLKKRGTGILIITHFLLFAQNVADRIVFLKNGRIHEEGDKQIMSVPKTKELEIFLNSIKGIIIK